MKRKLSDFFKKAASFLLNPRLLFCFGVAWMCTNGWAYAALGMGMLLKWNWLVGVATAYLTFLWFPFTPEKIVTTILAIQLLRWLFPNDTKTLGVLKGWLKRMRAAHEKRKARRRARREKKQAASDRDEKKSA